MPHDSKQIACFNYNKTKTDRNRRGQQTGQQTGSPQLPAQRNAQQQRPATTPRDSPSSITSKPKNSTHLSEGLEMCGVNS